MPPIEQAMIPSAPGPGSIPLSTLIDYIIQRTYHELQILSELLPRKSDFERKIEIVQFASRTRQLFVRLLALVRWANSVGKVERCAEISLFLDQQSMLFVETADMLSRMSRETLVQARLPNFSIPCAVDVLTSGTYRRLPACIKEKIVSQDAITPQEKHMTLMRLNQIIEHRLVTSDLPPLMRWLKIENGRVKFHVEHEFEVTLTLMGDGQNIPWRLLTIDILVKDPETGDGKALVHSLQVHYIHQLIQTRLVDNDKPLHDLYNCLHSFCQSLQLEVLYSQAERLYHQRLKDLIHVEYSPGKCLTVAYWRDHHKKEVFKLSIHVDENEPCRPLQVTHFPQIHGSESTKVAQAIRSDHLSIEKLLIHTIQVRSLSRLKELERELRCLVGSKCEISDLPSMLYVPVNPPCMDSEKLSISVDIYKGSFLVSVGQKENSLANDIELSLNGDRRELRKLLARLRLTQALNRCVRSAQQVSVSCYERLPIVNLSGHPLDTLGPHKLFVKLPKQPSYYLVVEAREKIGKQVELHYFLLHTTPWTVTPDPASTNTEVTEEGLKAGSIIKLDTFAITHGPFAKLHDFDVEQNHLSRKKKKVPTATLR